MNHLPLQLFFPPLAQHQPNSGFSGTISQTFAEGLSLKVKIINQMSAWEHHHNRLKVFQWLSPKVKWYGEAQSPSLETSIPGFYGSAPRAAFRQWPLWSGAWQEAFKVKVKCNFIVQCFSWNTYHVYHRLLQQVARENQRREKNRYKCCKWMRDDHEEGMGKDHRLSISIWSTCSIQKWHQLH